jgi:hypothetical protein
MPGSVTGRQFPTSYPSVTINPDHVIDVGAFMARPVAFGVSLMAVLCILPIGATADPPLAASPTPLPQLTVEAQRQALEQRVIHYVTSITAPAGSFDSLARWGVKVCPAVTGLPEAQGEFILQRISTVALAAGAPLGPSDCKPNLFVMVTSEPSRLIKEIWSRNPGRFSDLSGLPASPGAIRRFMDNPRPVRAWYGAEFIGAMGNELGTFNEMTGGAHRAPQVNRMADMSRIRIDDVQMIRSALVVVDVARIAGLKIGAVADYVALVGLAEINLDADFSGYDSLLRLFTISQEEAQAFSELGAWDAAFLKALYNTEQANKMQRHSIVDRMMREAAVVSPPR